MLFKQLVMEEKIAVAAGAHYMGTALDDTRFFIYAMPAPGVTLERLAQAIEGIVAKLASVGITDADLARAKTRLIAEAIYARDSQMTLANWYGASLATGMTLDDIAAWPDRIEAVTADAVKAAVLYLDKRRAVAGYLLPAEAA
jgi:zinc protease